MSTPAYFPLPRSGKRFRLWRSLRRWAITGLTSTGLLAGIAHAEPPVATVCIDHYPPFTYFRDGKPQGAMLDALRTLGDMVGFELSVSDNTAFARCLRMMEAGKVDFMVSLMPTTERLAYMVMYPYAEPESLRLIARAGFSDEPENLEQVLALRVGLINGYEYPTEFQQVKASVLAPTPEAGLRLLDANRIDVLVLNESVASHLASRPQSDHHNRPAAYKLLNTRIFREQNVNSIGLSRKSWLVAHNDKLHAAIAQLRSAGEFERLITLHRSIDATDP